MKKFMMTLMLVLFLCTVSYGAETANSDIYVRKEIFDARMDSINSKIDIILGEMKQIREDMRQIREEVKQIREDMRGEITQLREEVRSEIKQIREETRTEIKSLRQDLNDVARAVAILSQRIDNLDVRMTDSRNDIYLGLVILGIIFALPSVQRFIEWRDSRRPSITLEDVKRLIEESRSETRGA